MITNADITIYHSYFDKTTRANKWRRYNYRDVWFINRLNANFNEGYNDANRIDARISYDKNIDIENFSIGDIIVEGNLKIDINTQQDLKNYQVFNITSIVNNNYGTRPHIHLGGK